MECFKTPIALIIFNRPDRTEKIFKIISTIRPKKLFIIADGPRESVPGEKEICEKTRQIVKNIDWKCELFTNYSKENLGCGKRPSTGITWVFENVDRAIILEDDCVPHPTFFTFCEELLNRYENDERVMMISGNNFQFGKKRTEYSYYFSIFTHIWGWATWKRAWDYYDYNISQWPEFRKEGLLANYFSNNRHVDYWRTLFDKVYSENNKTYWDYQWLLTCWAQHGLAALPSVNLVSNEGAGKDATHTKRSDKFMNMKAERLKYPLAHPSYIMRNIEADLYTQKTNFSDKENSMLKYYKLLKNKMGKNDKEK
ncbi:MAG TPA: glycosyltransferase family 2 protein [Spirochaetota bacterium]|nr:glycosyltransferase family 2 protein [Spirochaetota bacterium]